MYTLVKLKALASIPTATSWLLAEIGEARGIESGLARRSSSSVRVLRESAIVESALASTRIEGVTIELGRVQPVLQGRARLSDRDEAEVRGYRDALRMIHGKGESLPVGEKAIKAFHTLVRGAIGDAGKYRTRDTDIIERLEGGVRVRFRPVAGSEVRASMKQLIVEWRETAAEESIQPLLAVAAFNLDFLCVHPFRDGNGRVSRLLLLQQCYHANHDVGRYISLERIIEEEKARYYETLEYCSVGWHNGKHDPWPYINFLLQILKEAYRKLHTRTVSSESARGSKSETVVTAIQRFDKPFRHSELVDASPGVSRDTVRRVLRNLKVNGIVTVSGRGPAALWRRKGITTKKG